jgi:DNA/RNA endonuclease YhcR with UshA esterase domain
MRLNNLMKKYFLLLPVFLVSLSIASFSQKTIHYPVNNSAGFTGSEAESVGFGGTGTNIDVIYHRTNWSVNPNTPVNNITGAVTTYFKTIAPNVSSISFDLNKSSFNNASLLVKYHGITCTVNFPSTGNVNVLNITLPNTIVNSNTIDSVSIDYSGTPVQSGFSGGFPLLSYTDQFGTTQNYILTLSESYEDRDWWPCKADMQDKIDSMDINVTVPWQGADTFWVASNGILVDSAINGTERTFRYKSRYPIASYLVCLAAAKYNRYYSSVTVGNTNVPVYWYLLAGKTASYYTNALSAMAKMNAVVQAYSSKLGDYPFKKEKHGFYDGLSGAGGMEHQTFSAIAPNSLTSLATLDHELMHQWFGDNVTMATWNDLWLAEGFARYGEILSAELVPSLGYSPYIRRNGIKNSALGLSNTSLWIPNASIANSSTIWNSNYGSAVYERGAMIVSMLRTLCGDDKFFEAVRNYQTNMAGRAANADSLKNYFNAVLDNDLTEFFNDYVGGSASSATSVGGKGNPVNTIKWNSPSSNKLLLGVQTQNRTTGSNVSYFNGPVVVRATGSTVLEDTTIVFFDWGNGNLSYAGNGLGAPMSGNVLSYELSFKPSSLVYDDSARTLSTGATLIDTTLKGYIWYGTSSSDWYDAANWASCCGVPPANADVTIATVINPPVLPGSVTVKNLTINTGRFISIANNTLTVNGSITGAGAIKGSASSNLVLNGKTGSLNFLQNNSSERSLQSLTVNQGSNVLLVSDLEVASLTVNPLAVFAVAAAVKLITK